MMHANHLVIFSVCLCGASSKAIKHGVLTLKARGVLCPARRGRSNPPRFSCPHNISVFVPLLTPPHRFICRGSEYRMYNEMMSCPTSLPFNQTKHSTDLLASLCISHIFNLHWLAIAATLHVCALDWWTPPIQKQNDHENLRSHGAYVTPLHNVLHVIFTMNPKLCIIWDSLWGWTGSCWGRRAICWERFASGSRTANRSPTDTEPGKQKQINMMLAISGSKKNYVMQWLSKESSYE